MNKQTLDNIFMFNPVDVSDTWAEQFWWRMEHDKICNFLIVKKTNYCQYFTCKSCKKKIHDEEQLQTMEPYMPTYHIKCYMKLFNILQPLVIKGLQETINDVDLEKDCND